MLPLSSSNEGAPLQPQQVKYLALEGGGGSGNAFPGAIRALEDDRLLRGRGILQYDGYRQSIGFAGASSGAITALFLSCGYDSDEITYVSSSTDFGNFFDKPVVGQVPRIGGCRFRGSEFRRNPPPGQLPRMVQTLFDWLAIESGTLPVTAITTNLFGVLGQLAGTHLGNMVTVLLTVISLAVGVGGPAGASLTPEQLGRFLPLLISLVILLWGSELPANLFGRHLDVQFAIALVLRFLDMQVEGHWPFEPAIAVGAGFVLTGVVHQD